MVNKIVSSKNIIAEILCVLAIALFIPEIINLFNQDFRDVVFTLILYSTAILSAVYILVLLLTKKELTLKALILPVILLFGGVAANSLRNVIEFNSWSSVYYTALYIAAIIAYFLLAFNENKKEFQIVVYILFLIILATNLLGVFGGGAMSLARLIIGLIIIGNVYLNLNNKEEGNNENN
jgi:hypothetical protein